MKKACVISLVIVTMMVFVMEDAYAAETLRLITWSGYAPKVLLEQI